MTEGARAFAVGERVETKSYGEGGIVRLTTGGAVVALELLGGLELEIVREDLRRVHSASPNGSGVGAGDRSVRSGEVDPVAALLERLLEAEDESAIDPPFDLERFDARRSIEALRFGIVPARSVKDLTVGFEKLQKWVKKQLPDEDQSPTVSEVCGRFGTGKSHTMAAIRHIAETAGYVHAQVEVDGRQVSLSDPAGVLRQLWKTLTAKDLHSNTPLVQLMLTAAEKNYERIRAALDAFPRVMTNLLLIEDLSDQKALDAHSESLEMLLSCSDEKTAVTVGQEIAADPRLFGRRWNNTDIPMVPKVIIGRKVDERADDFVNCLLGYAVVCRLAGFNGLVVTIDEFEVEYMLTSSERRRLEAVLERMTERLAVEEESVGVPLAIFIATVGQEGEDSDPFVDEIVDRTSGGRFILDDWTEEMQLEVAAKIDALYGKAYGIDVDPDITAALEVLGELQAADGASVIRAFIKRYVAYLDTVLGPPA